ncbi:hypothetical protein [Mixta hanseatica]|uniref:Immunity protein 35 domain-containing protein n=1 Tax=Mixta hanseatica TaxID=2872648 RepID=A0ABY4R3X2_9GAMM|nr:hypothetical protein [Mixta hanseatica]UQY42793.1 hypothetical protein K6958_12750 [Mixta hanseatica]
MDKEELLKKLNKLSIPNDSYSIGSIEDESLCMIFDGLTWCVFYSERGHRKEPEYFASENDACHAFLTRIKNGFDLFKIITNSQSCPKEVATNLTLSR